MKHNEWYTPPRYINAARQVLGSLDLDPASCKAANQRVQATQFYTKEENGLTQEWYGNVFCNPPFTQCCPGQSSIKAWVGKTIACYQAKKITAAILLVPNDTSTRWFKWLWEYPVCFPARRIQFDVFGEKKEQPTFGTCFVYLGPDEQKFARVFSQFGTIVRRVNLPAQELWNLEAIS